MVKFTVEEILKATNGVLLSGSKKTEFSGVSTDTRTLKTGELFLAIKGQRFDGHDFMEEAIKKGASGIILQKYPVRYPLSAMPCIIKVDDAIRALGDIAHYHRQKFDIPVVAITGSNGKTTTKEMIASCLAARYKVLKSVGTENNNIGVPKTILGLSRDDGVAVLEVGTNHFGEIRRLVQILSPTIGVITNIGPSHLEFLKDLDGVFREKTDLFHDFGRGKVAVLNGDDPYLSSVKGKRYKILKFGTKPNSDFQAKGVSFDERGFSFTLNTKERFRINLLGMGNLYNALAAIVTCKVLGVPYSGIKEALLSFKCPKMRMEKVKLNGMRIINDAYNSNPHSLKEAISWLGAQRIRGRKFLVAADMLELGKDAASFHKEAGEFAVKNEIDYVICYGQLSRSIYNGAIDAGLSPERALWFNSANSACDVAAFLKKLLKPGDLILVKGSRAMKMEELVRCFTTSSIR